MLGQCRKPSGWLGRFILWSMNRGHSRLTDWGLEHVRIGPRDTILDVGCGGGRTVQKLAALAAAGRVYGVDFSEASVAMARGTNRESIAQGRVTIQQATVSQLPFGDAMFDLVTAVETHYYWPDLPADVREVKRVMKRGGTFLLIAEAYRGFKKGKYDHVFEQWAARTGWKFAQLTPAEHQDLLQQAGYADVQVFEDAAKGWICVTGHA